MIGQYIFPFVVIGVVLNPMNFWEGLFIGYLITVLWLVFMYWLVSKSHIPRDRTGRSTPTSTGNEPTLVSKYSLPSDPEKAP